MLTPLPAKIHTEDEHRRLLGVVTELCSRENEYEDEHFRPLLPAVSPLEMVKYLMEQRGLKAKDMVPLFNSRGLTSDILNGKRQINKNQAKKLAEFFQVTVDVFL
jgi:HTH-type transcriptional regulator/antitoxin HigA